MEKRYAITKEFVFADCLVTPSVYGGVLERLPIVLLVNFGIMQMPF